MGCQISKGDFFLGKVLSPLLLEDPQAKPLSMFVCRMTRGQDETSTSQVGRKRGIPWETPIASSLVAAMSVEELRSFSQVPIGISLGLSDSACNDPYQIIQVFKMFDQV